MKTATSEKVKAKPPRSGQATRMSDISQVCTGGSELERGRTTERNGVTEIERRAIKSGGVQTTRYLRKPVDHVIE